ERQRNYVAPYVVNVHQHLVRSIVRKRIIRNASDVVSVGGNGSLYRRIHCNATTGSAKRSIGSGNDSGTGNGLRGNFFGQQEKYCRQKQQQEFCKTGIHVVEMCWHP